MQQTEQETRTGGAWAFASRPKAVRKMVVEEELPLNIMADPRVVRGSTYSLYRNTTEAPPVDEMLRGSRGVQPRRAVKRVFFPRSSTSSVFDDAKATAARRIWKSDEAVVDVTPFLIEKPVVTVDYDEGTQTDAFLEQPPTLPFEERRVYAYAKKNPEANQEDEVLVHKSTSMEDDGGPFDFEVEVQPLLEVLVGKTLEQALVEVYREEELEAIAKDTALKNDQRATHFEAIAELERTRIASIHQKQKDLNEARERASDARTLREKVRALQITDTIYPDIKDAVFKHQERTGAFIDPIVKDIRQHFLPVLYDSVAQNINERDALAKHILDDILRCTTLQSLPTT